MLSISSSSQLYSFPHPSPASPNFQPSPDSLSSQLLLFHIATLKNSGTSCVCPISSRPGSFRETHHRRALLQCPQARTTHHEEDAPLQWCLRAQGRVKGLPRCRVLQKGCRSGGCASRGPISPRSLPTGCRALAAGQRHRHAQEALPPCNSHSSLEGQTSRNSYCLICTQTEQISIFIRYPPFKRGKMRKEELQCQLSPLPTFNYFAS